MGIVIRKTEIEDKKAVTDMHTLPGITPIPGLYRRKFRISFLNRLVPKNR